jgi:hypothetical protein
LTGNTGRFYLLTESKLLIAAHKTCDLPRSALYVPIEVGAALREVHTGTLRDDTGEHISTKNASYSELTALYWAWKNGFFEDVEYCGLVHYRRYFRGSLPFQRGGILSAEEIGALTQEADLILPKKRNYWIESIGKHYIHAHHKRDLDMTEAVLSEVAPEYIPAYREVMKGTRLHLYNMFVMPVPLFESYAAWLFGILFEVERRIDISGYDPYQKRVFGFLAERLFNVWTRYQAQVNGLKIAEVPVVNTEGENLLRKGMGLLKRKYRPKGKS